MSLQKQKIVDTALKFFAEKGYAAASIQEIANECGIAKGSVYKFFASKEDLFVEVYRSRIQRMFELAEQVKSDTSLSPRERLIRETRQQFDLFMEFKASLQEFYELPVNEESAFGAFLQKLRAHLLLFYKDCMLRAYGPVIEPYQWDVITLYVGLLKQYMMFGLFLNSQIDFDRVSEFIADRMDDMTAGILRSEPEPIFRSSIMEKLVQCGMEGMFLPTDDQRTELLARLRTTIRELNVPNGRKAELEDAAELLREEFAADKPRTVLIRAMIDFLRKQHELAGTVGRLEKIIG